MRSVRELVKYNTKSADFAVHPGLVEEFIGAFKGQKRIQFFGSFANYEKEARAEGRVTDWIESEHEALEGKPDELVGCRCGQCKQSQWVRSHEAFHVSETVKLPDGSRQLALFEWLVASDPPRDVGMDAVFELTPEQMSRDVVEQRRLRFREMSGGKEGFFKSDYAVRQRVIFFDGLLTREVEEALLA
jgi:hypothetical protein